jgi:hypothetical protein
LVDDGVDQHRSARIGDVDHDGRLVETRQHLSDRRRFIARRWRLSDAFLFGDFSSLLG